MTLVKCKRIVVFLHPGQLTQGLFFPVVFLDCNLGFENYLDIYKDAIKLYDGPPNQDKERPFYGVYTEMMEEVEKLEKYAQTVKTARAEEIARKIKSLVIEALRD